MLDLAQSTGEPAEPAAQCRGPRMAPQQAHHMTLADTHPEQTDRQGDTSQCSESAADCAGINHKGGQAHPYPPDASAPPGSAWPLYHHDW